MVVLALFLGLAPAAPAQEGPRFDVLEYVVEGNSVLGTLAIERAVYPHLGEKRTIEDVERARASLEAAYRDAGYATVVVDIPVQKADEGIIVLKVTEGRVERVRVTGNRYYAGGQIRERSPALAEGEVPYFPALLQDLAQLNRSADRRVTPVLRAGTAPGTTELELKVEDRLPLHGDLELNNRYSPNTTRTRFSGGLRYANFLARDHTAGLQFQVSPEDANEVKVLLASYALPVGASGSLQAYYVRSRSNVGAVGDLRVLGDGDIAGLRAAWPLRASGNHSHSFTLGIDRKSFEENVTQPGSPGIRTPIRYHPVSADYSWFSQDSSGTTQASLGAVASLRGLGNDPLEFENKRFKAQSNFLVLRWDLRRTQALGKNYSVALRAAGQLADQPLISNEQFFAGGAASVRGYLESEALGDRGMHLSAELRGPSLAPEGGWLAEARLHAFLEGARLRLRAPLPAQRDRFTLSSGGLGLRLRGGGGLEASLDLAWPFKATANTPRREPRAQFSLSYRF
jgi:hemolysin activation/secretion protein